MDLWISFVFLVGLCFKHMNSYSISYQSKYQKGYYILSLFCASYYVGLVQPM